MFRKLNEKATVFIEYAPLETAWVPIEGENFIYLYCLWACGPYKGKGYGRALIESCIADARQSGKAGVCMLGRGKGKRPGFLDQAFAKKFGFTTVDTAPGGYELLALSFNGTAPHFAASAKSMKIESQALTIYHSVQCPYTWQSIEMVRKYCAENHVPVQFCPWTALQRQSSFPVCSTTGPCSIAAFFKR